jgi:sphingomyelin phosphodiesterase acid-like 3
MCKKIFFHLIIAIFILLVVDTVVAANNFLVISDIHLQLTASNMEFAPLGYNPYNDLDTHSFKNMLKTLRKNIDKGVVAYPEFIIILGDLVGHHAASHKETEQTEVQVFRAVKDLLPQVPVFYVFGNNDSSDADYGPFKNKVGITPFKIAKKSGWSDGFLSTGQYCAKDYFPCILNEKINDGYYSAYLADHLRFIVLNSVLFSKKREHVTGKDAEKELNWFKEQLQQAQAAKDSVLIAMHIPCGSDTFLHSTFWKKSEQKSFLHLIDTYSSNIIGILVGHTHFEEIKILQNDAKQNIAVELFTPALSTSHGNAPGVKSFFYAQDDNIWALTDYKVFTFLNANHLEPLYVYNGYYCMFQNVKNVSQCLRNVTAQKLAKYYTNGNHLFSSVINYPDAIYVNN